MNNLQNITDDRLMAMCQICHLRYDSKEKFRRRNKNINNYKLEL